MKLITSIFTCCIILSGCSKPQISCPAWYEGIDCQTQIRQKWIGTFTGTTRVDADPSGYADTFIFVKDSTRIDFDNCINKNFDLSMRNSREASFNDGYGVGIISEDGKFITLTYSNLSFFSSTGPQYTFQGSKQ